MSCLLHASENTYAMIRIFLYPALSSYCSYFLKHMLQDPCGMNATEQGQ